MELELQCRMQKTLLQKGARAECGQVRIPLTSRATSTGTTDMSGCQHKLNTLCPFPIFHQVNNSVQSLNVGPNSKYLLKFDVNSKFKMTNRGKSRTRRSSLDRLLGLPEKAIPEKCVVPQAAFSASRTEEYTGDALRRVREEAWCEFCDKFHESMRPIMRFKIQEHGDKEKHIHYWAIS